MWDIVGVLVGGKKEKKFDDRGIIISRDVPIKHGSVDLVDWGFSLVARTDYLGIGTTFDLEYPDPNNSLHFVKKTSPTQRFHDFSDRLGQLQYAVSFIEIPPGDRVYKHTNIYYHSLLDVYAVQKVWVDNGGGKVDGERVIIEEKRMCVVGLESKIDGFLRSL